MTFLNFHSSYLFIWLDSQAMFGLSDYGLLTLLIQKRNKNELIINRVSEKKGGLVNAAVCTVYVEFRIFIPNSYEN